MKIEQLTELGIEEEIANKVISVFEKELGKEIAKYNDYDNIKKAYEQQGSELKKLKKLKPEELKDTIEKMSMEYEEKIESMEKQHMETLKKMAIKSQIIDSYDPELVLNCLDLEKIIIDYDGNIKTGFNDQIQELKKNKEFLFKPKEPEKAEGIKPFEGEPINEVNIDYAKMLKDARENGDNLKAISIINEASEKGILLR